MKLLVIILAGSSAFAAGWEAVQRIPVDQKIEVSVRNGPRTRAAFVSANGDAMVVHDGAGDRSIARAEILRVRAADPGRRVRKGLLWTLVGAGSGVGIGWAVCPHCANEGNGSKFIVPGVAIGATVGSLGFLSSPYRTVYQSR